MRKILVATAVAFSLAFLTPAPLVLAVEGESQDQVLGMGVGMGRGTNIHRLGLGVNYWRAIGHLDEDVSNDGFSYIASYQYAPVWFFKVETDLEFFPELAGKTVLAPELFLTLGGAIYAGLGTGIYFYEGEFTNQPFFMLRAGVDIPVLPRLFVDINVNYRFNDWDTLEWNKLNTDTIRLGATLRFTL